MCIGRIGKALVVFVPMFGMARYCPAAEPASSSDFQKQIAPLLELHCLGCHSAELKKGGISLEFAKDAHDPVNRETWLKSLKMVRAGLMPPKKKERLSADEVGQLEKWIKYTAFGIDPKNPNPGHVTLRRLNRTEYRNTIRDLMGVDFNATVEFPADDTGHGFDNIGDVLSISPLLLEKYIAAAKSIVGHAVPLSDKVPAERRIAGQRFTVTTGKTTGMPDGPLALPYVKAAAAKYAANIETAGSYKLLFDISAHETYVDGQNDYNKCRVTLKSGDKILHTQEFVRQGGKTYKLEFDQQWDAGTHPLSLELEPLTPKERQVRNLTLRLNAVTIRGPMAMEHWVRPANYERFFPGIVPEEKADRRNYTRTLLGKFTSRAFRRPVDETTVDRLVSLAESMSAQPGKTFEAGIAHAMIVVLASPRFLFREEAVVANANEPYPLLDEYSLASRLSYFLWSTMPDEELMRLASESKLRSQLSAQVMRMLADKRSGEFVRNFAGQWLQTRSIDSANVNAAAVLSKDEPQDPKVQERRTRFRELNRKPPESLTSEEKKELDGLRGQVFGGFRRFSQFELNGDLRRAMRQESEMAFEYIVRNNRSLLELIDSDYTFLNERLAKFYGIDGVTGDAMRKFDLPKDSPRGGILTHASTLIITSNPDRTSPVKRGMFILDNILGTPSPPPPPDITPLEQAAAGVKGKPPTLRETLKLHRADALCSSCHNRMDPLGLAFENFNALGRFREKELNQPIKGGGELITGEPFQNVRELKRILATDRRMDYYRTVTEKMMMYALGRAIEPGDTHTMDEIVNRLEAVKGKPSELIRGIIDSPAFQRRGTHETAAAKTE